MATRVHFGELEGLPIRWTDTEGWLFSLRTKTWDKRHPADLSENATPLSREDYEHMFRDVGLKKLPATAFEGLDTEEGG